VEICNERYPEGFKWNSMACGLLYLYSSSWNEIIIRGFFFFFLVLNHFVARYFVRMSCDYCTTRLHNTCTTQDTWGGTHMVGSTHMSLTHVSCVVQPCCTKIFFLYYTCRADWSPILYHFRKVDNPTRIGQSWSLILCHLRKVHNQAKVVMNERVSSLVKIRIKLSFHIF